MSKRWKFIEVDFPVRPQLNCPADGRELKVIDKIGKIRLGGCKCGYVGYIDRPTEEWINNFYAKIWDAHGQENYNPLKEKNLKKHKKRAVALSAFLEKHNIPKDNIVEIGCGVGKTLNALKEIGFTNLAGTEFSEHRAKATRAKGFEINNGKKYKMAISYHVLEHTYNPLEFIKRLGSEYLFLALPNSAGEPNLTKLLYLPHLHSFSRNSLQNLLCNAGYKVIDKKNTKRELNVLARKGEGEMAKDLSFIPYLHPSFVANKLAYK